MQMNVVSLRMSIDSALRLSNPSLKDLEDAVNYFKALEMHERATEHIGLLCLDAQNRPTAVSIVSVGGVSKCYVDPRSIFSTALLSNASSIVVAHNHPSGVTEITHDDFCVYQRLREAGALIGVEVTDFLILSPCGKWDSYMKYERNDLPSISGRK